MGDGLFLGGIGFAAAIVLILIEVPVGVAMGLVGLAGCAMILGVTGTLVIGATTTWESLTNYTLTMLPLFVLMGNLAAQSQLSSRLYAAMRTLIGHRHGGIAMGALRLPQSARRRGLA